MIKSACSGGIGLNPGDSREIMSILRLEQHFDSPELNHSTSLAMSIKGACFLSNRGCVEWCTKSLPMSTLE